MFRPGRRSKATGGATEAVFRPPVDRGVAADDESSDAALEAENRRLRAELARQQAERQIIIERYESLLAESREDVGDAETGPAERVGGADEIGETDGVLVPQIKRRLGLE